ncbi:immunity 21 family protein [Myxococcus sp. K15C18031901]|nr:immunity 21 family protein [Myxococcus dinghuensis]
MRKENSLDWGGVDTDDYDEACGVSDFAGVISREWGDVLVLGDEPLRTSVIHRGDGVALVRWGAAPDEDCLIKVALGVDLSSMVPSEILKPVHLNGTLVVFDAGAPGGDARRLEFTLTSRVGVVRTYVVNDAEKDVQLILHQLGG